MCEEPSTHGKYSFSATFPQIKFHLYSSWEVYIQRIFWRSRGLCSPLCTLMKIIHKFRPQCMAVINWAALMNIFRLFSSHQVGIRRYLDTNTSAHRPMHIWTLPRILYFFNLSMKTHTCGILKWMASSPSLERLVLSLLSMIFNHVIVVLNFNLFS